MSNLVDSGWRRYLLGRPSGTGAKLGLQASVDRLDAALAKGKWRGVCTGPTHGTRFALKLCPLKQVTFFPLKVLDHFWPKAGGEQVDGAGK